MKKISENAKCFPIVLFSFWFLIFPAYLYFSIIDNSDIPPSSPLFEKIDQEDSIPISGEKENILELTFSIKHALITYLSLAWVPNLSYQLPALDSKPLILRC
jgi:hypothetical protein